MNCCKGGPHYGHAEYCPALFDLERAGREDLEAAGDVLTRISAARVERQQQASDSTMREVLAGLPGFNPSRT